MSVILSRRSLLAGAAALIPAVARAQTEFGDVARHQIGDVAVLDQHPLGLAGGARGVDHIGKALGRNTGQRGLWRLGPHQGLRVHDQSKRQRKSAQPVAARTIGQNRHRLRVLQNFAQPVVGKRGVQTGKRRPRPHHRDLRHIQRRRIARDQQRDDGLARLIPAFRDP